MRAATTLQARIVTHPFTPAQAFDKRQIVIFGDLRYCFYRIRASSSTERRRWLRDWENILAGRLANRLPGSYMNGHHSNQVDFGSRARAAPRERCRSAGPSPRWNGHEHPRRSM